ncbi:MAG: hypothetical protein Q8Q09_08785 [Deltaproteobacteria bacterium]|nr:hypothetical protein [Deltaproteobacteria bacterium]
MVRLDDNTLVAEIAPRTMSRLVGWSFAALGALTLLGILAVIARTGRGYLQLLIPLLTTGMGWLILSAGEGVALRVDRAAGTLKHKSMPLLGRSEESTYRLDSLGRIELKGKPSYAELYIRVGANELLYCGGFSRSVEGRRELKSLLVGLRTVLPNPTFEAASLELNQVFLAP